MILEGREIQESWLIFRNNLLQAQDLVTLTNEKSSKGSRRPVWMKKEPLTKLRHESEEQEKEPQRGDKEEYRDYPNM